MGGFDYPNGFVYDGGMTPDVAATGAVGIFVGVYILFIFLTMAFSMLSYILHSLGLYTIAQRRGLKHSWLAWVPFGNVWLLGSISDQYQYIVKGKVKNRRKVMLGLNIGVAAIYVAMVVILVVGIISGNEMAVVLGILFSMLAFLVVIIALTILMYISYYDLYRSCQPSNAELYLVLSIVVSITLPLLVFFCRKKDLGMPPRKQQPVQTFVSPVQQPYTSPVQTYAPPVYAPPVQTYTPPVQPFAAPVQEQPAEIVEEPADGFAQPEEFEE